MAEAELVRATEASAMTLRRFMAIGLASWGSLDVELDTEPQSPSSRGRKVVMEYPASSACSPLFGSSCLPCSNVRARPLVFVGIERALSINQKCTG